MTEQRLPALASLFYEASGAPAGEWVGVRLTLDGVPIVLIADGQGGWTNRPILSPNDYVWLVQEQPEAASAVASLYERRAADVASGEFERRLQMVRLIRADLAAEAGNELLSGFVWEGQVAEVTSWVADYGLKPVRDAVTRQIQRWDGTIDAVWEYIEAMRRRAAEVVKKADRAFTYIKWGAGGVALIWVAGKVTRPWRKAAA